MAKDKEMQLYFDNGQVDFTNISGELLTKLPVGVWEVKLQEKRGYYLQKLPDFELPPKIYGRVQDKVDRYLNTFANSNSGIGVLLTGLKGTGKSLLAKATCIQSNLPVIVVNAAFGGPDFTSFISGIDQEAIVLFDEFEKVYGRKEEGSAKVGEELLSLLDGVYNTKKLYILTCNNKNRITTAFFNRPGRIRYLEEYNGLREETMIEIVEDLLVHDEYKTELIAVLGALGEMNVDLLLSIIAEMNMYKEPVTTSLKYLNLIPEPKNYKVTISGKYGSSSHGTTITELDPTTFFKDGEEPDLYEIEIYCKETDNPDSQFDHRWLEGPMEALEIKKDEKGYHIKHIEEEWVINIVEEFTTTKYASYYAF